MNDQFHVLAVCTGNICRSPAVERLLTAALGPRSGVEVRSAGLRAVVGAAMPAPMVRHVRAAGADPDGFAGRQVTVEMIRRSDLVLALTREHRALLVEMTPAALRRTFTLLELARLAALVDPARLPDGTPGERFRALLPLAATQRARQDAVAEDDVVDPFGGDDALYERSFGQLRPAVEAIARVVRG